MTLVVQAFEREIPIAKFLSDIVVYLKARVSQPKTKKQKNKKKSIKKIHLDSFFFGIKFWVLIISTDCKFELLKTEHAEILTESKPQQSHLTAKVEKGLQILK